MTNAVSATEAAPTTTYLKDYQEPDFLIEKTELTFNLYENFTAVTSNLTVVRAEGVDADKPLVLNGVDLVLESLAIDGSDLNQDAYKVGQETLTIKNVPKRFQLSCETRIEPQNNTSLEGLYKSRHMFCTQCEAEGFRKITYYLDRPDVLSEFTTTIIADKHSYPVLLSNGNLIKKGELNGVRHYATWHDPFKKPSYLFALVAGELVSVDDTFTTMSGRTIEIKLYVEEKDLDKCEHALVSLKKAMKWDEDVYGREYDLDIFMIVAVDDFNMGAMENKGLNIFNTSCVLANPEITTDAGFHRVEAVVAHEYFHNLSRNRVTCRDWFQLSLKEGFTVFRDAEFSADMGSRTVKRVEDVGVMRTLQFAEDAGPMSHPVRPASYMEISNFYTLTVYEKGAEVVRMIHTLLGSDDFRKGSDIYFARHDGEAATIEDFVSAMEEGSGKDLSQFMHWYSQAGTPSLSVNDNYDADKHTYTLTFKQSVPSTPEATSDEKKPFQIPVALGLLSNEGEIPLVLEKQSQNSSLLVGSVLSINQPEQSVTFTQVNEKPVPVMLKNFSAPVKLEYSYSRADLLRIMALENDGFCRWDASQQLAFGVINDCIEKLQLGHSLEAKDCDASLIEGYQKILVNKDLDLAMVALMLQLPSQAYIAEQFDVIDVDAIYQARKFIGNQIVERLYEELLDCYQRLNSNESYDFNAQAVAKRSLKNTALHYLMKIDNEEVHNLCLSQYNAQNNMTDVSSALRNIVSSPSKALKEIKQHTLTAFYQKWQNEPLVVNLWLSIQATCDLPGTLDEVIKLTKSSVFDLQNPNKVRSLIGAFAGQNAINFHTKTGEGYQFLADQIIKLNLKNPQIAARLITPLTKWKRYDSERQKLIKQQLERIKAEPKLSKDVFEVVDKSLSV